MPFEDHDDARDDERETFRPPLPPDDRIWLHPSEIAAGRGASRRVRRNLAASGVVVLGAAVVVSLVFIASAMHEEAVPTTATSLPLLSPVAAVQRTLVQIDSPAPSSGNGGVSPAITLRSDGLLAAALPAAAGPLIAVLADGRRLPAVTVGSDTASGLTLLRIDADNLRPTPLADDYVPTIGDTQVAIDPANAAGAGTQVVVQSVDVVGPVSVSQRSPGMITVAGVGTGAAPNPGAVLVDGQGRVTGLCVGEVETGHDGNGSTTDPVAASTARYAIPAGRIMAATQLVPAGEFPQSWLGLGGADADADNGVAVTPTSLRTSPAAMTGARVTQVDPGGPAARAGLQPGDVIMAIDGNSLDGMADLVAQVHQRAPGDEVTLSVRRDHDVRPTKVKLAVRTGS